MSSNITHQGLKKDLAGLHWIHWCVILASLVMTLSAWRISKNAMEDKITNAFDRESQQIIELITERMQKYEDALWAGVAMIHSHNQEIDHESWLRFTQTLEIESKYPGVNGIGVIHYVPSEYLQTFLNNERLTRPDFRIHPQHDKDEYWPITYIEPMNINQKALGLDIAHENNRHTAAKKARDTGKAQISGPIVLVQDSAKTPGFLFYAPYYSKQELNSVNDRQAHFIGLVYAPFIMSKLMEGTLQKEKRHIGIKISEGKDVLYDEHISSIDDFDSNPLFTRTVLLDFYGRPWEIDLRSSLDFRKAAIEYQPLVILVGGIIIELLLIILFVSLARTNRLVSSQLETSEKSRHFYIEASGDGYWDWYIQKDYEYMSPRFWEILGYSPDEKPHKPSAWQDIIFEDDLKLVLDNLDMHVKTKGQHPYEQQVRYHHKNGSTVTVLCRGKVIEWDEQDNPVRMVGTHTDITELKEKEQKLKEVFSFQKLLMDTDTDLIFVKDKKFRIVQANLAFLNLYPEGKRDSILGTTTIEDYPADQAEMFLREDKKAFTEGESEVVETIDFPDGKKRTLLTKKIRFEDATGEPFILGTARDISKIKKMEDALVQANAELEEFAYRTSHDLRSPLISSTKLLNMIRDNLGKGEIDQSINYLNIVQSSLKKLEDLLSDILKLTKLNYDQTLSIAVDIKKLVDDSLQKLTHMDGYDRIHFIFEYEYDQPIAILKEHLALVIENLLSNAIKYQDYDKEISKVSISTKLNDDGVELSVTDNGLGIPARSREKIFLMFKRFHPNISFGSGLGLYMVKKSVDKMEGTIEYRDIGEGSQFTITLPISATYGR